MTSPTDEWEEEDDCYELTCPILYYQGRLFEFHVDRSAPESLHSFGGACKLPIHGMPDGQPDLHQLLVVDLGDPLVGIKESRIGHLPLVYGFRYDECRLKYAVSANGEISIQDLSPDASEPDWPYEDYPGQLPKHRLRLTGPVKISPDDLEDIIWQSADLDYEESVIIVVPPSEDYGISLWGELGDAEEVSVVFEVDPGHGIVSAFNQCG